MAVGLFWLIVAAHAEREALELAVRHGPVDRAHVEGLARRVGLGQEEHLAGALLADLAGEVGRAEPAIEAGHVGVGLLEARVLLAGQGQVAHDVEAVPTAGGPARHDGDHHLGHEADEALHLEDVQPAQPGPVLARAVVLVAVRAADPLVPARAEGPDAVAGRRAVPGQEDAADVGRHVRVLEGDEQLVDGLGPEGVAHLGAVEGDAHGAVRLGPVVGDVGEVEARHLGPRRLVEEL